MVGGYTTVVYYTNSDSFKELLKVHSYCFGVVA